MNESPLKKYFEPSAFKKTIAKNAGIEPLKPTEKEKKMKTMRKNLKTGFIEEAQAGTQAAGKLRKEEKRVTKPNPNIHTGSRDFEPAFEGADHTQEELDNMTKKQQEDYYN